MPSSPTTLAELVEELEAEAKDFCAIDLAIKREGARAGNVVERTEYPRRADLMERAAKVLRAVETVPRRDVQNGPDCIKCDEYERVCDCAEPEVEIEPGAIISSHDLDAAITRALGGSDAG